MKKIRVIILVMFLLSLFTIPVAASDKPTTGEQIRLFADPVGITFPAGSPFFIKHGYLTENIGTEQCEHDPVNLPQQWGVTDFKLEVDGVFIPESFVEQYAEPCGGHTIHGRWWVFNFPAGMTGTHTFTGHWYMGCVEGVEVGYIPGPCKSPGEQVEVIVKSLTVEFVEP